MFYFVLKISISALLIASISEIAKRSSFLGAFLASLPLLSILAMIWMYIESKDTKAIAALSTDIFWLVIPSLVLFVTLPILLNRKVGFYWALGISILLTVIAYAVMMVVLKKIGR